MAEGQIERSVLELDRLHAERGFDVGLLTGFGHVGRLSLAARAGPNRREWRSSTRTYNCPQASDGSGDHFATDADLWRELRHGRQAADRVAEDRRRQPLPADLDRAPGGRGDPDEAPRRLDPAPDDARSALRSPRAARR